MNWPRIWAMAVLQARLLLRSWRFWILVILAAGVSLIVPLYYGALRFFLSGFSGTSALIHPSLIPWISNMMLTLVLGLAVVWFAFDAPYRHRKTRTEEVLHASPASTADLVLGMFLGIMIPTTLTAMISSLLALGIQVAWRAGMPVTAHAVQFLFQTVPSLAIITAITLALAVLTRSRVAAAILGTAVVVLGACVLFGWIPTPLEVQQVLDLTGLWSMPIRSEMVGYLAFGTFLLQRVYILFWAAAFLAVAIWRFPRLRAEAGMGLSPVVAAACAVVALALAFHAIAQGRDSREAALTAAAEQEALTGGQPTRVAHYDLNLDLSRRGRLDGRAVMRLHNDTDAPRTDWVFLLNSGLEVEEVEGAEYERGLTTLVLKTSPVPPGGDHEVAVSYGGPMSGDGLFPGGRFELRDLAAQKRGNLALILGDSPYILDKYAYLPPMSRFYPVPDVDHGYQYPRARPSNWATLRLEAQLPEGWVLATQGRPEEGGEAGSQVWVSEVPVPEISVYAGPYQMYEAEVGELPVRLYFHPGHKKAVDFFSEARDLILERAAERMNKAQEMTGLSYPYPVLSLVELPLPARAYTDGLDSFAAFHTPGVVAMREAGLFTANLETAKYFRRGIGLEKNKKGSRVSVKVQVGGGEAMSPEEMQGEAGVPAEEDEPPVAEEGEEPEVQVAELEAGESAPDGTEEAAEEEEEEEATPEEVAMNKAKFLEDFFRFDFIGGSVPHAVVPSLWDFVVQPVGRLNPLMKRGLAGFVAERATGSRQNFSVFALEDLQQTIPQVFSTIFRGMDIDEAVVQATVDMDKVYEVMTTTPLAEMDPAEDPRAYLDVVTVRGHAFFQALEQELGPSAFAEALALLRERHAYANYTLDDLRAVVEEVKGEDFGWLFQSWLEGTDLPGFRLLGVEAFRIESEDPRASYQVTARLENAEEVAGYATIELELAEEEEPITETLRIEGGKAIEWGIVVRNRPQQLQIKPVLAHNRLPINKALHYYDWSPKKPGPEGILEGVREIEFEPWATGIVVDDLDEGFRIEGEGKGLSLRFRRSREEEGKRAEFWPPQQGFRPPRAWSLWKTQHAYGKYNPTFHVIRSAGGKSTAVWEAELPDGGEWEVMVHMPGQEMGRSIPKRIRERLALSETYTFRIATADGEEGVPLDTGRAEKGWNSLGSFFFDAGPVQVSLSDDQGGGTVLADAVRFVPAGDAPAADEESEDG